MKRYKIFAAVIIVMIFALAITSCMKERGDSGKTVPSETQFSKKIAEFDYDRFYVMVGTMGDNDEYVRLRYFNGDSIDMVVWKHSPEEYKYGDVFIPEENVTPVNVVINETDPASPRSWYELQESDGLELIGNSSDLFERKVLMVTRNEYDGMRHFSIYLTDHDENEYYYGFMGIGTFGVDLSCAGDGDLYECAVRNGKIIIPLEGPET